MNGDGSKPSAIAVDECFAAGDDALVDELRRFPAPGKLISVAERWKVDPRPWARRMIRAYLDLPMNCPGHEPLVKRLFKHAEAQHDHEVMGWFAVALDRIVRRRRVRLHHYDHQTRQSFVSERLRAASNTTSRGGAAGRNRTGQRLFSHRTRYYLRRRVWRYFRTLSHRDGEAYRTAIAAALKDYRDRDFTSGEAILDNWSLVHACYHHSPVIRFGPSLVHLVEGRSLGDLDPAPYQPDLWRASEAFAVLLELAGEAGSSLVRQWALEMIRREHQASLTELPLETLLPLLTHRDPHVQEFAAGLFGSLRNLGSVALSTWLDLLETENLTVLTMLCEAIQANVAPERFSTPQLIELTTKVAVPVARMGFAQLQARHRQSPCSNEELAGLAGARCEAEAGAIAAWALEQIGGPDVYDLDLVIRFFDALQAPTRKAALDWLVPGSPGWDDPRLWARLIETPFPDVRDALIERLEARIRVPSPDPEQLTGLWCTVILGVHRGGRQKPKAVRQIVRAIQRRPARSDRLAPVLAIAVRSVRGPEQRAGLAAVAELVETCPDMQATFAALLPELHCPAPAGGTSA